MFKLILQLCVCLTMLIAATAAAAEPPEPGAKEAGEDNKGDKKEGPAAPATPLPPRGLFLKYQLTKRMFKKPKDYFRKALGGKLMRQYYEKVIYADDPKRHRAEQDPTDAIDYNVEDMTALVVVSNKYDARPGWGVFLHIGPDKKAIMPDGWGKVIQKHKYIYVAPHGLNDKQPDVYRMAVALDALATVENEYPIDKGNVIVSGEVRGASIATMLLFNFPDEFRGIICQGWSNILSRTEYGSTVGRTLEEDETRAYWNPETPGINPKVHRKVLRKKPRIVLFNGFRRGAGPKENEVERVLRGAYTWAKYKYNLLVLDIPATRGYLMSGDWLDKSIAFIKTGKKPKDAPEPRYDLYDIKMPDSKKRH